MTNFARWSLVLVLRVFFGGLKSRALVNFFMNDYTGDTRCRRECARMFHNDSRANREPEVLVTKYQW
jgi:hypothetical protein